MWRHLDRSLGSNVTSPRMSTTLSAKDYHRFINDKVSDVRSKVAGSGSGSVEYYKYGGSSSVFKAPTILEVIACVRASPNKQCLFDPLLTWLLEDAIVTLDLFLTVLLPLSLSSGKYPTA